MAKLSLLRRWFDEFNERYFGGELPTVPLRITRARKYFGKLDYIETGKGNQRSHAILIAGKQSIDDTRDTLLHEMVHLYIYTKGLDEQDDHGPNFKKEYLRVTGKEYVNLD